MFIFDCTAGLEWNADKSECVKESVQASRPLHLKSKTKNLSKLGRKMTLNDPMSKPIISEETTTTTTTTTTPETTTTTTTEMTTTTEQIFQETVTSIPPETTTPNQGLEDFLIIKKVRQPVDSVPSRREQELLMNQIRKQEVFVQQSLITLNEIARQHQIDDEIKLKQQIEQQKLLLKQKFVDPRINDSNSVQEIQDMIHQHEINEQNRLLNIQRKQQEKTINEKKFLDKQHMDDQLIVQKVFHLNHLDKLKGAIHQ